MVDLTQQNAICWPCNIILNALEILNHGIVSIDIWTLCEQYMKITKKWSLNKRLIQKQLHKINTLA